MKIVLNWLLFLALPASFFIGGKISAWSLDRRHLRGAELFERNPSREWAKKTILTWVLVFVVSLGYFLLPKVIKMTNNQFWLGSSVIIAVIIYSYFQFALGLLVLEGLSDCESKFLRWYYKLNRKEYAKYQAREENRSSSSPAGGTDEEIDIFDDSDESDD